MKALTRSASTPFDAFREIIPSEAGDAVSEGEIYFWAAEKKKENLDHIASGHDKRYGVCRSCGNCKCDFKRFRCLCSAGRTFVTPYRIRSRF